MSTTEEQVYCYAIKNSILLELFIAHLRGFAEEAEKQNKEMVIKVIFQEKEVS